MRHFIAAIVTSSVFPTSEIFFRSLPKRSKMRFGLFVLCNNEGRCNRKSNQGQIITKKDGRVQVADFVDCWIIAVFIICYWRFRQKRLS